MKKLILILLVVNSLAACNYAGNDAQSRKIDVQTSQTSVLAKPTDGLDQPETHPMKVPADSGDQGLE